MIIDNVVYAMFLERGFGCVLPCMVSQKLNIAIDYFLSIRESLMNEWKSERDKSIDYGESPPNTYLIQFLRYPLDECMKNGGDIVCKISVRDYLSFGSSYENLTESEREIVDGFSKMLRDGEE